MHPCTVDASSIAHRARGPDSRIPGTDRVAARGSAPGAAADPGAVRPERVGLRPAVARDLRPRVEAAVAARTGVPVGRTCRAVPGSTVGSGSTGQTLDRSGPPVGTRGCSTSPAGTGCRAGPRSSWAPGAVADSASGRAAGIGSVDRMGRTGKRQRRRRRPRLVVTATRGHPPSTGHHCLCYQPWMRTAAEPRRTPRANPTRVVA